MMEPKMNGIVLEQKSFANQWSKTNRKGNGGTKYEQQIKNGFELNGRVLVKLE